MNCYATVTEIQAIMGSVYTTAQVLRAVEAASREVDGLCGRVFWSESGTRHYDVPCRNGGVLCIDDLLSASAVSIDDGGDGDYSVALVSGTDYEFLPEAQYPKRFIRILPWADNALISGKRTLRIAGVWGYGDGLTNDPWRADGVTATVADATSTAITLSGTPTSVEPGQTIRVGVEQMFVQARSGTNVTAIRGVNGSTASAHAAVDVEFAVYPALVVAAATHFAIETLRNQASAGVQSVRIGQYSETAGRLDKTSRMRLLGQYRKAPLPC